jgi:4-amino-4-deoxy-L-arabinose transferase-like glycosyltransferase
MRHIAWKQVAWLLTLAGIVRLGAAVYWHQHWHGQFVFGDSQGYFELGRAIAHGQAYQLSSGEQVFRAPGYPLLLSPVLRFFDGHNAVWVASLENCLFGSLTVLVVSFWAWQVFGPRAAWIAGLITALYPEAVAISVPVLSEAPFCLLVAVNLAIWTAAYRKVGGARTPPIHGTLREPVEDSEKRLQGFDSARNPPFPQRLASRALQVHVERKGDLLAILAGALAGAATLVRPSWILFLPLAFACGLIYGPRSKQWLLAVAVSTGFLVVMTPWWVRNYRVTGHFVPTTLQVGASLYDGWNPQATGASDMRFVPAFAAVQRSADADRPEPDGFEYRLDRRFRRAAWDWACANPGRVVQLAAIKFLRIWNVWPNEPTFAAWPVRLVVLVTYVPLMLLAALGARQAVVYGWPGALCWLPAVYFSLLHTVFVSSIRYRQPAMLGLIVLAAGYLAKFGKAPSNLETESPPFSPSA